MKIKFIIAMILLSQSNISLAENGAVAQLMKTFISQGAITGDAIKGEQLWNKTFTGKAPLTERSCASCHSSNLANEGKHARTGKTIEPLAPSVNQQRLSDINKINKWFKRNCKWTLGRVCTAQEKADILSFINQQ